MIPRRGTTLAELVVAFTMVALVAALGAAMLASAERQLRTSVTGAAERRVVREVGEILQAELAAVPRDDVYVRGDTAVDLLGDVAVSLVCVATGRVLVLPPERRTGGTAFTTLRSPLQAGDLVSWFDTVGGGTWVSVPIDSVASRADGAGCTPSTGFRSIADSVARRPAWRLVVGAPVTPVAPPPGAPVRIRRPARYALYVGSDRRWALGLRSCDPGWQCGPAQPVAGPLAAPADSGLRFVASDSGAALTLWVRTPVPSDGRPAAARRLRIVLHNGAR